MHSSYWWRVETVLLIFILAGVKTGGGRRKIHQIFQTCTIYSSFDLTACEWNSMYNSKVWGSCGPLWGVKMGPLIGVVNYPTWWFMTYYVFSDLPGSGSTLFKSWRRTVTPSDGMYSLIGTDSITPPTDIIQSCPGSALTPFTEISFKLPVLLFCSAWKLKWSILLISRY